MIFPFLQRKMCAPRKQYYFCIIQMEVSAIF